MDGLAGKVKTDAPIGIATEIWQETATKASNLLGTIKRDGAAIGDHIDFAVHHPSAAATTALHGLEAAATTAAVFFVAREGGAKLVEAAPKILEGAGRVQEYLAESLKIGDFGPRLAVEGAYNDMAASAIGRESRGASYVGKLGSRLQNWLKPVQSNEPMMMANIGGTGGGGADRSITVRNIINRIGASVREFTHAGDRTTVQVTTETGKIGVRFPDGAVRQIDMQTPIKDVNAVESNGVKQYYLNGSPKPNLAILSDRHYMEAGLHNGDVQIVVDTPGGTLDFTHSDNSITRIRPGRIEIQLPGGKVKAADLPSLPEHVQITEHANGGKTFQFAQTGQQDYSMRLKLDGENPPLSTTSGNTAFQRPAARADAGSPPVPSRNASFVPTRPERFAGGVTENAGARPPAPLARPGATIARAGTVPNNGPGGRPPFTPGGGRNPLQPPQPTIRAPLTPSPDAGFVTPHRPQFGSPEFMQTVEEEADDRYPFWRLNVAHDADRAIGDALTGIDHRAHIDMHSPTEVAVGQMDLPWFMEDYFNKLGRH